MSDEERTKVAPPDPLVGQVLDRRYKISMRIASGGFASIYQATQLATRREVALKVLHSSFSVDPAVIARFRREAAALGQLRDIHTIKAYDFGEAPDGTLYIAMELLKGESLDERYRARGALPWRSMVSIARAVCQSLAEAHEHGIVHRDLKPTNIHIEPGENVKVLDFGIAKIISGSELESADLSQGITHAGQMIGTFDYMAPEQMLGGECTGQSDIFTLGVVIYEMIAGEKPYGAFPSTSQMLAAMMSSSVPRVSKVAGSPPALDAVLKRCLDPKPSGRYANVHELKADLDSLLELTDDDEAATVIESRRLPDLTDRTVAAPPIEDGTWVDDSVIQPPSAATLPGGPPPRRTDSWETFDPSKPKKRR